MKLSALQIFGFKSYADRAELIFAPGTTGIVGPAGCGKLVVLETIRWALGASSQKDLRVDSTQELIFAGTSRRRPMTQATVSLVFSDCPADWELPGNHLRVTRQVNRAGDELLTGRNGALDAETVSDLLRSAGISNTHRHEINQRVSTQLPASTIGTGLPRNFG